LRIIITGSREHSDEALISKAIAEAAAGVDSNSVTIVHGAARGADTLAANAARRLGLATEAHAADWDRLGKRAGFIRNAEMAKLGADICLAFPIGESRGTRMMIDLAKKHGIEVQVYEAP